MYKKENHGTLTAEFLRALKDRLGNNGYCNIINDNTFGDDIPYIAHFLLNKMIKNSNVPLSVLTELERNELRQLKSGLNQSSSGNAINTLQMALNKLEVDLGSNPEWDGDEIAALTQLLLEKEEEAEIEPWRSKLNTKLLEKNEITPANIRYIEKIIKSLKTFFSNKQLISFDKFQIIAIENALFEFVKKHRKFTSLLQLFEFIEAVLKLTPGDSMLNYMLLCKFIELVPPEYISFTQTRLIRESIQLGWLNIYHLFSQDSFSVTEKSVDKMFNDAVNAGAEDLGNQTDDPNEPILEYVSPTFRPFAVSLLTKQYRKKLQRLLTVSFENLPINLKRQFVSIFNKLDNKGVLTPNEVDAFSKFLLQKDSELKVTDDHYHANPWCYKINAKLPTFQTAPRDRKVLICLKDGYCNVKTPDTGLVDEDDRDTPPSYNECFQMTSNCTWVLQELLEIKQRQLEKLTTKDQKELTQASFAILTSEG